jgi:hypothetical protein
VKKRSRGGSAKSIRVLLRELPPPSLVLPSRDMERILAEGDAAVPAILSALEEWEGDENRDQSLLAILLGEIRPPEAGVPLARLLRDPDRIAAAVAAAEALAKIGPLAVPALMDVARDPDPRTRLFAYGALGAIPDPEAYQVLLDALDREPELTFVVAMGVAAQGGEASIPALLRSLERCPAWQRGSVEEAIRLAHEGGDPLPTIREDWRLRYRILPKPRIMNPGPLGMAAILYNARDEIPASAGLAVRSFREILAPLPGREPDVCEGCGGPITRETGIPVCPDDALAVALDQREVLEEVRSAWDEESVLGLLEAAEAEYLWLTSDTAEELQAAGELEDPDDPRTLEEEREEIQDLIHTLRWVLMQGAETVREGRARLLAQAGLLADRFGDPEGLLADRFGDPGEPLASSATSSGFTAEVGRNDPCPCGSGRKYKKCCGKGEPAALGPKEPSHRRGSSRGSENEKEKEDLRGPDARFHEQLYAELYRLARNSMTRREQEEALVRYFGPDFRGKGIQDVHPKMEPAWAPTTFFEWLVFDYRRRSGRTLSEEYLERKGWTLDARSRALLEGAMGTCMSLYRVEEVRPEEGLTLRDLFRGGTVEVLERLGTRELVRWDILAARIQEMDGGPRFTGGLIHLEAQAKDNLLLVLENGYVRYRVAHPGADRAEFLKERGDLFYQMGRALADRPRPSLVTSEGDPLVFCRARYRVEETEGLVERLGTVPSLEPMEDEEGGEGSPVMFRWVEPLGIDGPVDWGELLGTGGDSDLGELPEPVDGEGSESAKDTQGIRIEGDGLRSLGTLTLEGDRLVLECSSEARLARGKALLEEHLPRAVTHLEDEVKDPWEALEEEDAQAGGKKAPPSPGFSPEVEKQLHQELMDRHYRPWMDKPIQALAGKTPREAVATAGGRGHVADLIRQGEHGEALRQREKGYAYDFTWLWKELGLDPAKD